MKAGTATRPRKLSYKDQRELDSLPQRIEALDAEQTELQDGAWRARFLPAGQG